MEFPQSSVFHLLLPSNIFVLSSLAPCSFLYKKASPLEFLATIVGYSVAMEDEKLRKGPWYEEEDERLTAIVAVMGERRWDSVATVSGLRRSGKSCRMRWMNYLRPNLKHGRLSAEEERIILQLHKQWGNKWSKIARRLPGRTDNEIKNYWRSHLRKNAQVREQGNYDQSITNNAKQDVLVPKFDNGDCTSVKENILRTTDDHSDVFELSNYGIASSPYEVRISDWMSSWSDEQSEVNRHHGECQSLDSGFCCYSVWNSKDHSDNGLWDSSDFLWDTD